MNPNHPIYLESLAAPMAQPSSSRRVGIVAVVVRGDQTLVIRRGPGSLVRVTSGHSAEARSR